MGIPLLAWPAAIAIGASLGLLGSGGSILTVPLLVYVLGQDEKVAIAGSLAVVGTVALVGSLPFLKERLVDGRAVVVFGVPAAAGSWLGSAGSAFVPGYLQLALFAVVMLVASFFMLRPPRLAAAEPRHRAPWRGALDGLGVGALTGMVGVGGGFLIVPALVLQGGLPMRRAIGTSLMLIAIQAGVGFVQHLRLLHAASLSLDWPLLGLITTLAIVGSLVGTRLAVRLSQLQLRRVFGVFLIGMGIYILVRSLH